MSHEAGEGAEVEERTGAEEGTEEAGAGEQAEKEDPVAEEAPTTFMYVNSGLISPPMPKGCQPCLDLTVCLQSADRFELFRRRLAIANSGGGLKFCRF